MRPKARTARDWKRLLRPLANETRLQILRLLLTGEKSAGELAGALHLAAYTISHQMQVLAEAGLIRARRAGRFHFFRIHPGFLKHLEAERVLDLGCCSFRLVELSMKGNR